MQRQLLSPRREGCRFISASTRGAQHLWEAIPCAPIYQVDTPRMLIAAQRRLGLCLTCLRAGRSAGAKMDPLGDSAVNHSPYYLSRHNCVSKCWARYGGRLLGCPYDDTRLDLRGSPQAAKVHRVWLVPVDSHESSSTVTSSSVYMTSGVSEVHAAGAQVLSYALVLESNVTRPT